MLVIDILAVFPFYLFSGGGQNAKSNAFIRLLRLARLTKLVRVSKIIQLIKTFSTSESVNGFFRTHNGVARLIGGMNVLFLLCHFTACMWYYTARLDDFNPETWVVRHGMEDSSKFKIYLTGVYWALTVLTTVGFGDYYAKTEWEKLLCIVWMIFGIGFYSFILGSVTSVLESLDA